MKPDARIVNLETAVTVSADAWPGKGIHYRMHPANVAFLSAAAIDCCVLANNHVLDWGYDGLRETRTSLRAIGVRTAGAGDDETEASAPAVIELSGGKRVLVFAYGSPSSGVPRRWAALRRRPGIALFDESDPASVAGVARHVAAARRPGDVVVVALHWGGNWGFEVPQVEQQAARRLIDEAGVDVVYGHSSHHPRPVEVYRDRLILYGCGDFLNDYEGIRGYERFRPELGFMYLPDLDPASGRLRRFVLVPTRIRRFRVNRATEDEAGWLVDTMNREGRAFGSEFVIAAGGTIELRRDADASAGQAD
jgi:poly-gamma-glutamate synthesis protein (capsule biosynthesis protein)